MAASPRSDRHIPGTCPELLPYRPGDAWSRGPDRCNRPVDRLGRCKLHATAEEKRARKYHTEPDTLPQP